MFAIRESVEAVEEGTLLSPKFDAAGLIPVITSDYKSKDILMHGYMNEEALQLTLQKKEAVYYSRSRKKLWHKGEHSGFVQKVVEIRIDDDQDALWLSVDTQGKPSCHVGYRSCFYRNVALPLRQNKEAIIELDFNEKEKLFNASQVYEGLANPTKL